jgi:hypothetical protein
MAVETSRFTSTIRPESIPKGMPRAAAMENPSSTLPSEAMKSLKNLPA